MLFWIITAVLTAAASLAVMYPFLRRDKGAAEAAYDLAVYKDQLAELENEVKRGLISEADAAEARAEIGRRILKLNATQERSAAAGTSSKAVRAIAVLGVLAVPVVSWAVYSYLGSPGVPAMPLAARLQEDPANAPISELIARAEAHLASNPDDRRGWEALAPIYMRLGRFADAARAYQQIIALGGATANTYAMLGEALVGIEQGIVTAEAVKAFENALAEDPAEPRSRFFVALAKAQEGKIEEARALWTQMVADLPEGSPWRGIAEEALKGRGPDGEASAQDQAGSAGPRADGGSQQSPDGQQQMIEEMVARLDARLRESPNDPEGWQRLVRSYIVLQRTDAARDALQRGVKALGENTEAARDLSSFARGLGLVLPEDEQ
ncbi:c-type cytochrome biogenesis protein CcmI [Chelativorans composti]|jgi:cytochrome c-type biogenesis protein CcmI|uniref:C-type cytochrome biogenesis protein CcmI n=1 Tax=Chelativorans composti TaxID=768533 RepID=A0ABW5DIS0_9HYPH